MSRSHSVAEPLGALELQPQMKSGIVHILQDSGCKRSVERIPLEGKRRNEELTGVNKITRRLFDLCCYILVETGTPHFQPGGVPLDGCSAEEMIVPRTSTSRQDVS